MAPRYSKPVSQTISDCDHEIGLRLGTQRRREKLRQSDLAKSLGLTREMVSRIEAGRVPLKLETGWNAARLLGVHPSYFLTGQPDPFPELLPELEKWISDFCRRHHAISFRDSWGSAGWTTKIPPARQAEVLFKLKNLQSLPPDFYAQIDFEESPIITQNSKIGIDTVNSIDTLGAVRTKGLEVPTWPDLKKSVQRLTAKHGSKSALAGRLGVTRQVLNNWLSAESLPNAVLTLELFRWVKKQEQDQK